MRNDPNPVEVRECENARIADLLRLYAELLEVQGADGFRVRAYERAADSIDALETPLSDVYRAGGLAALIALPTIGKGIAAAIVEMIETGRWSQLDRVQGQTTPAELFQSVPGIGRTLAGRFENAFGVDTLEDLEAALRDPARRVSGLGPRRRRAILASLSERLAGLRRRRLSEPQRPEAPIALLLDADASYRRKAEAGELHQIAPRRMNPGREAWLPIMHLRRGNWHLTALYSNTPRAHDLGATRDWVVLYYHLDEEPERQCTVVTERTGPLAGKRVVRGRERDCMAHYAETTEALRAEL